MFIRKVWINTDSGIDDFFAIMMLLLTKEIQIVGISTSYGNTNIENATKNILSLCHIFNREDIPIVKGASKPLFGNGLLAQNIHGVSLANLDLPTGKNQVFAENPYLQIKELMRKESGKLTYIDIGPNTNSALLFTLYPELLNDKIDQIVVMGGARKLGNVNYEQSEFNFFNDPIATKIFFSLIKVPFTLITADECEIMTSNEEIKNMLSTSGMNSEMKTPNLILKLQEFLQNSEFTLAKSNPFLFDEKKGVGAGNFDEMASAYLINPSIFRFAKVDCEIEASQGNFYGRTIFKSNPDGKIKFLAKPDRDIYLLELKKIFSKVVSEYPNFS